ncbi:UNVERIFIED_CONTAM: hypothetical protein FKN15_055485 [Acipenser sinensis]
MRVSSSSATKESDQNKETASSMAPAATMTTAAPDEAPEPPVLIQGLSEDMTTLLIRACVSMISVPVDPDTLHATLRLCLRLTRTHQYAMMLAELRTPRMILGLAQSSGFNGFTPLVTLLFRHIIEDPATLRHTMEKVVRSAVTSGAGSTTSGVVSGSLGSREINYILRVLGPAACRDPDCFTEAATNCIRIALPAPRGTGTASDDEFENLRIKGPNAVQLVKTTPLKLSPLPSIPEPIKEVIFDMLNALAAYHAPEEGERGWGRALSMQWGDAERSEARLVSVAGSQELCQILQDVGDDVYQQLQAVMCIISTIMESCPSTSSFYSTAATKTQHNGMNNIIRLFLKKGLVSDLARVPHSLDLSSPNMANTVNAALKPLETLSRIVNQPSSLFSSKSASSKSKSEQDQHGTSREQNSTAQDQVYLSVCLCVCVSSCSVENELVELIDELLERDGGTVNSTIIVGRSGEDESQEDVLMDETPSSLCQTSTLQANREDSMNILDPEDEEHTQEEDSSGSNEDEDSQDEEEEEEEDEEEEEGDDQMELDEDYPDINAAPHIRFERFDREDDLIIEFDNMFSTASTLSSTPTVLTRWTDECKVLDAESVHDCVAVVKVPILQHLERLRDDELEERREKRRKQLAEEEEAKENENKEESVQVRMGEGAAFCGLMDVFVLYPLHGDQPQLVSSSSPLDTPRGSEGYLTAPPSGEGTPTGPEALVTLETAVGQRQPMAGRFSELHCDLAAAMTSELADRPSGEAEGSQMETSPASTITFLSPERAEVLDALAAVSSQLEGSPMDTSSPASTGTLEEPASETVATAAPTAGSAELQEGGAGVESEARREGESSSAPASSTGEVLPASDGADGQSQAIQEEPLPSTSSEEEDPLADQVYFSDILFYKLAVVLCVFVFFLTFTKKTKIMVSSFIFFSFIYLFFQCFFVLDPKVFSIRVFPSHFTQQRPKDPLSSSSDGDGRERLGGGGGVKPLSSGGLTPSCPPNQPAPSLGITQVLGLSTDFWDLLVKLDNMNVSRKGKASVKSLPVGGAGESEGPQCSLEASPLGQLMNMISHPVIRRSSLLTERLLRLLSLISIALPDNKASEGPAPHLPAPPTAAGVVGAMATAAAAAIGTTLPASVSHTAAPAATSSVCLSVFPSHFTQQRPKDPLSSSSDGDGRERLGGGGGVKPLSSGGLTPSCPPNQPAPSLGIPQVLGLSTDFWDLLVKLDNMNVSRKGKASVKSLPVGGAGESEGPQCSLEASPLGQLMNMISHPVIRRSSLLTERLLRLLSLISIALPDNKASEGPAPHLPAPPTAAGVVGAMATAAAAAIGTTLPASVSHTAAPAATSSTATGKQGERWGLAQGLLNTRVHYDLISTGMEMRLPLHSSLIHSCSFHWTMKLREFILYRGTRDTVLKLLLSGGRHLGCTLCQQIGTLLGELREYNLEQQRRVQADAHSPDALSDEQTLSTMLKGKVSSRKENIAVLGWVSGTLLGELREYNLEQQRRVQADAHSPDTLSDEQTLSTKLKGKVSSRFDVAESVVIVASQKRPLGGRELQLPSMSSLTSKTSTQKFFLRVLQVIIQLREDTRRANKKAKQSGRLGTSSLGSASSIQAAVRQLEAEADAIIQMVREGQRARRLQHTAGTTGTTSTITSSSSVPAAAAASATVTASSATSEAPTGRRDESPMDVDQLSPAGQATSALETHRTVLNQILRQSTTHLADGPFAVLVDYIRILDFDVKRKYFRQELERLDEGLRKEDMAVHVRRDHVFEDSYRELHRKSPEEMKNRLVQEFGVCEVRDLKPNGGNILVTEDNKKEYVHLVCQMKMTGAIRKQLAAFLEGFYEIIPKRLISIFTEQELELLISGLPTIDIDDLKANTEYHKYQCSSIQVNTHREPAQLHTHRARRTHAHTHARARTHTHKHTHTHRARRTHAHTHARARTHTHKHTHTHRARRTHAHTHARARTHTHKHTHTHRARRTHTHRARRTHAHTW